MESTNAFPDQVEEDDPVELIPESPCIDAKLVEFRSPSWASGSFPVREACSAKKPNLLQKLSVLRVAVPPRGSLVEVEGGFCVVRGIVRAVPERVHSSKRWMQTAMTTRAYSDTKCSSLTQSSES